MRIQIRVRVSAEAAARSGSIEHGDLIVEPTAEQWRSATPEQRDALVTYYHAHRTYRLEVPVPTWEAVITEIDAIIEKKAAEREEEKRLDAQAAEILPRVVSDLLARPIDDWLASVAYQFAARRPELSGVPSELETRLRSLITKHPEIAKRLDEARAEGQRRWAEYEARVAEDNAKIEARREQQEVAAKAFIANATKFAETIDDLARAAAEGYDVVGAVLDHIAERIADAPGLRDDAIILREGTREYDLWGWEPRRAPRAPAFRALDAIKQHVASVAVPDGLQVSIEKIMRAERDADDDRDTFKTTAIPVILHAPGQAERVVLFDVDRLTSDAE